MARVLIVGCGCRGRELAGDLGAAGHAVRGTTRDAGNVAAIEAAGAEGVVADPDRLGTLLALLSGVTVICWLMGSAEGQSSAALHGDRLESLLSKLVDSGVRGLVYEAAGSVDAHLLATGARMVRAAEATHTMPVAVVGADPGDTTAWRAAMTAGVDHVLSS